MKREYFVHNGVQYNKGTIIIIQWPSIYARCLCDEKATFLYYDTDTCEYIIEIFGKTYNYSKESFERDFKGVYGQNKAAIMPTYTKYTFSDELNIDGLMIAWIWYVFIMIVATIFHDRVGLWVLASIVFFTYRNNKLKEAGYK